MRVAPSVNPTRLRTAVLSTASPSRERCTSQSNKCSNKTYVRSFSPGSHAGYPVRASTGAEGIGRRLAGREHRRRGGPEGGVGRGDDPVVGEGRGGHRLLQEAVEEQAAVGRGAAVEAEGELVQVPVELGRGGGPLVGAAQPAGQSPLHGRRGGG